MSATSQHGFHPGVESLSAFAEQALEERERAEVLEHLAVCGRCRRVVALAREAADGDAVKVSAPPQKTIAPDAWWRQWRLAWVPAAIVAAFAAASVSTHVWLANRNERDFKIVAQNPTQGAAPASTQPATEQAEVVPPAAAAPAPQVRTAKQLHSGAADQPAAQEPHLMTAEAPSEPAAMDRLEIGRQTQPLSYAEAKQAPSGSLAGAAGSVYSQPAAAAREDKQKQAEELSQEQFDATHLRRFTLKSAPAAAHGAIQPAPQAVTQTVTVAAAPVNLETAPLPATPAISAGLPSQLHSSIPINPMHLPSGLAVVSSTTAGSIVLAIDKAGALFLSRDHGNTWERVDTQWTGRAVAVTEQFAVNGLFETAPATQNGAAAGASTNPKPAAPPPVTFELFNDKNQAWVSTDGRIWNSK